MIGPALLAALLAAGCGRGGGGGGGGAGGGGGGGEADLNDANFAQKTSTGVVLVDFFSPT
jgi:hypothetical protein